MMAPMKTKRLTLRPYEKSDLTQLALIAGEPDIAVIPRDAPSAGAETAHVLAEAWIDYVRSSMRAGTAYEFAVIERARRRLIGTAGLSTVDRRRLVGELSFWVTGQARGKGYATEAAAAVVDFAFTQLELTRLLARTETHHTSAIRVLHKLGFNPSVGLRRTLTRKRVGEDLLRWELHRDAWRTERDL